MALDLYISVMHIHQFFDEDPDEGIGIAPDKIGSLFKRFETLSKNNNILQPSSGIGLSLVKELVDMHHGDIEVKSQPGTGSEFSVTLPLEREVFEKDAQAELILADSSDNTEYITTTVENGIAESGNSSEEDFFREPERPRLWISG